MPNNLSDDVKSSPTPSSRLKSIDLLRGVAALAIVVSHATLSETVPASPPVWFRILHAIFSQGGWGVPLFFVISGFCIHMPWASRHARSGSVQVDWFGFWKRRIRRLYPPYFFALIVSMGLVLGAYWIGLRVPLVSNYAEPRLSWMGIDFILHVFMLHGFSPRFDHAGGNPVFWTLAREEYLYALYALLLWYRVRRGPQETTLGVALAGLAFGVFVALVIQPNPENREIFASSALSLWIQWCLGMLAVEAYLGLVSLPSIFRSLYLVPVWWIAAKFADQSFPFVSPLLWGLTFFTLVNWAVHRERSGRPFRGRFSTWLANVGIFSYSLYLIHYPVRAVAKQAIQWVFPWDGSLSFFVGKAVVLGLLGYWGGRAFFHVVERHFLNSPVRPYTTEQPQVLTAPS
jgi:peptidoglycan/LPS O-acetylase OafA/YrhL